MIGLVTNVFLEVIHLGVERCWIIDTLFELLGGQQVSQVRLLGKGAEDVNLTLLIYLHLINSLMQLT